MATNNDGWTVANAAEQQAYMAAMLPPAPPGKRGKAPAADPRGEMMETQKDRDDARKSMDAINRVQPQLNRVRDLYNRTLKGGGPVQSLREYLPSQSNAEFDRAAGQLQTLLRPTQRTTGEGSMSDYESRLAVQTVPSRYAFDASNEESIEGMQRFLDQGRAQYAQRVGQRVGQGLPTPPPAARKAPTREFTIDRNGNLIR